VELEAELERTIAAHRERIVRVHEHELGLLAGKWNAPAKRRLYSHASAELRGLRRQLRQYMLDCRFQDAEAVSAMAQRRELAEQAEAAKQMQHDFEEAQKKLRAKQAGELLFAEQDARVQVARLRQARARGRQGLMNLAYKFQKRAGEISDPEKLWNIHQAKRREEAARGGQIEATPRLAKLAEDDLPAGDDALIALPPLRMINTI
jgi:hypothetical protein